jgi:uncharacterized membrane protein YraQ (UPF0718 family)
MTFRRLTAGHVLALVAALALLLAMAPDWYTDKTGEQDRLSQRDALPQLQHDSAYSSADQAGVSAEAHEKNAWQASALVDRLILLGLLATAALAIAAAFMRAAGRGAGPPSLSALATVVGLVTTVLVGYRIAQPPGLNQAAVVKWGAPVGLICVGLTTLGSRMATRGERERTPVAEPPAPPPAPAGAS